MHVGGFLTRLTENANQLIRKDMTQNYAMKPNKGYLPRDFNSKVRNCELMKPFEYPEDLVTMSFYMCAFEFLIRGESEMKNLQWLMIEFGVLLR